MEQVAYWVAVAYDGSYNKLLRFSTRGDSLRDPGTVSAALIEEHPDVLPGCGLDIIAVIESSAQDTSDLGVAEQTALWAVEA